MSYDTIQGSLSYLFIHIGMVVACVALFPKAPDDVQRALLVLMGAAFGLYALCDALQLGGYSKWDSPVLGFEKLWEVRLIAAQMAKTALMLYLVRQVWVRTGFCESIKGKAKEG